MPLLMLPLAPLLLPPQLRLKENNPARSVLLVLPLLVRLNVR
jgi:hypothetical protein